MKNTDFLKKFDVLRELKDNYDGYGAISPTLEIVDNAVLFHKTISDAFPYLSDCVDVTPTPYGTIVIDYQKDKNLVSIECADKAIGFFADFDQKENIIVEREQTDFKSIPDILRKTLSQL